MADLGDEEEHRDRDGFEDDPLEPRLTLAWCADPPPGRFADRVMAARESALHDEHVAELRALRGPTRWLAERWRFAAAIGGLTLVASVLILGSLWRGGQGRTTQGTGLAVSRETFRLGGRGVAMAEPGTALQWTVDPHGAARIEQREGSVFYRVERGGPFVVVTPAGEVSALGTSFRVEVRPMKASVAGVTGAVVGATLGALVAVAVYEGRVLASTDQGRVVVGPGERATLQAGAAPRTGAGPGGVRTVNIAPAANATRAELLERDRAQRREIAELRARVMTLETWLQDGVGAPGRDRGWLEPGKDELLAMAKRCEVRFDSPPVFGLDPPRVEDGLAVSLGLTGEERGALASAMQEMHSRFTGDVRKIYVGVTGDAKGAESLTPAAMGREIEDKSPRGAGDESRRRLALERAGLVAPPTSLDGLSPAERYLRLIAGLGPELEQRLGERIGPARAHELRAARNGWPHKQAQTGCGGDPPAE
jgi:ferric-dicitrate binding protein FerR (iron transport regulator)